MRDLRKKNVIRATPVLHETEVEGTRGVGENPTPLPPRRRRGLFNNRKIVLNGHFQYRPWPCFKGIGFRERTTPVRKESISKDDGTTSYPSSTAHHPYQGTLPKVSVTLHPFDPVRWTEDIWIKRKKCQRKDGCSPEKNKETKFNLLYDVSPIMFFVNFTIWLHSKEKF